VAAAALEQSMLESKDKDTLLEMAKALGVKANSRLKKADIITKILDTTGSSTSSSDASGNSNGSASDSSTSKASTAEKPSEAQVDGVTDTASKPDDRTSRSSGRKGQSRSEQGDTKQGETNSDDAKSDETESADAKPSDAKPQLGADGEPLADWEIQLAEHGVEEPPKETSTGSGRDSSGSGGDSQPQNRNTGRQQRTRNDGQDGGNRNDGQGGGNRNNPQGGGNRNNPQGGEGTSRRRRRRRKGRGGQEGPQGDDIELLEADGQPQNLEPIDVEGYLDIRDEGYGFLRVKGYLPSNDDAYIPVKITRQYGLRRGDHLTGKVRPAGRNEKNPGLLEVYTVNGADPELAKKRPHFEDLTALFPDQRLQLEDPSDPANMTARIIDLVSPIGKGQRGIIVSPPKAGKTTVMKTIAKSIELNNPDVELMVLLIDERPEEVTDMRRSVQGEVISSTFDRPSDEHTQVAEMTIAKARRLVEGGKDVVIMLDGITRLSRAYNLAAPASGKILSGGIDAGALYPPKKFFGSARNVEEGGSLTILATALVDTNSRMDEAIFEEFKGTGNMELRLDRKVAERRIYPAIDVDASSTRHEELLFDRKQLQQVWKLRRVLSGLAADGSAAAGLELLMDRLKTFRTNDEFLAEIAKQPSM
jgi:transcription termination factor Rho